MDHIAILVPVSLAWMHRRVGNLAGFLAGLTASNETILSFLFPEDLREFVVFRH